MDLVLILAINSPSQSEGPLEGRGVNREEYGREPRGERFPTVKPRDSDILRGEGAFARESHQMSEFGPKRVERERGKGQPESDVWAVGHNLNRYHLILIPRTEEGADGKDDGDTKRIPGGQGRPI